jgi:uncharacterized protein
VLTSDLLVVTQHKKKILPHYLESKDKERFKPVLDEIIRIFKNSKGKTRGELRTRMETYDPGGKSFTVIRGLIKLLFDRCEFEIPEEIDPVKIRQAVFYQAAEVREKFSEGEELNRNEIFNQVAKELNLTPDQVEGFLYADLPDEQILQQFKPIKAEQLLERYNVALAQAVLYKATKIEIKIKPQSPQDYRFLFRYIKFFRLIHYVTGSQTDGYHIVLDGPFSLFQSVQKYGFQLALFLPVLLMLPDWTCEAHLLWGKAKKELLFLISSEDGLKSHYQTAPSDILPEIDQFYAQFKHKQNDWEIFRETELIDLLGKGVCIPDFVFTNILTGKRVYLEVFGYWSRDLVFQRLELLQESFPNPLILVVSKKLRISEEVHTDESMGSVLVYNSVIPVKEVLKRLDLIANSS